VRRLLPLFALVFSAPLLAAPVPEDKEKPKPRAKLLGTLTVTSNVRSAHWMPDGKHLVLVTDQRVLVYPRDQVGAEKPKPLTAFDRPGGSDAVRLTADGGLWALATAGRKVNAENRLYFWSAKALTGGGEPKADRVIDLEADNPFGVTVSADGVVFATLMTTRAVPNANPNQGRRGVEYVPTFLRMSGKTGDVVKKVAFADLSQDRYAGSAIDPRTGRLYLAVHTEGETVVTCREPDAGKQLWERKLPVKPDPDGIGEFLLSPDGDRLLFRQPTLTVRQDGVPGGFGGGGGFAPPPGARGGGGLGGRPQQVTYQSSSTLVVLDAKTGEPGSELTKGDQLSGQGHAFSADGRLLFAGVGTPEGSRLAVWDLKAGTELKGWARANADANGVFAPNGYELLIVERERTDVLGPRVAVPVGGGQAWDTRQEVIRVDYTSTVGIWDLSPVVK
jgi:hypothetical protein